MTWDDVRQFMDDHNRRRVDQLLVIAVRAEAAGRHWEAHHWLRIAVREDNAAQVRGRNEGPA